MAIVWQAEQLLCSKSVTACHMILIVLAHLFLQNYYFHVLNGFTLPGNIDISFVWDPYSPLCQPIKTQGISLYHLDDLVTNKAITLGRRPARRDYVDLFFFLKWKLYTISDIINMSNKRFGGEVI